MKREIDYDYQFEVDDGFDLLPKGMTLEGDLYVLPNGKYLPPGGYMYDDGSTLIYEPRELSPWKDMLAQCTEE